MSFRDVYGAALNIIQDTFTEEGGARYFPKKGGPYTITAIFDDKFLAVDPDTEEVITANAPRIGVNLVEMKTTPEQGDELVIRDHRWRVKDSQEDGLGGATLLLQLIEG